MAETSRPWAGTSIGDAGPYSDTQWSNMFMKMIGVGANSPNKSVVGGVDNELRVTAQSPLSNAVDVQTGAALVQGRWYESTTVVPFTIAANGSGNPRIDMVVLRVTFASQIVRLALLQGTAAATPAPPTLTQNATTWEVPLALVNVANGFSTIDNDDIINSAGLMNTPYQVGRMITNNEGAYVEAGSIVLLEEDEQFRFTAGGFVPVGSGVLVDGCNDGEQALVVTEGFVRVRFTADIQRAVPFTIASGVGIAWTDGTIYGVLLEDFTNADMDTALCYFRQPVGYPQRVSLEYLPFTVPNNSTTTVNWSGGGANTNDAFPIAMWNPVSNPTRITFQVGGFYQLNFQADYVSAFTSSLPPFIEIVLNGAGRIATGGYTAGAHDPLGQSCSIGRSFSAGDYIEATVYQASGAARNANLRFSAVRIST